MDNSSLFNSLVLVKPFVEDLLDSPFRLNRHLRNYFGALAVQEEESPFGCHAIAQAIHGGIITLQAVGGVCVHYLSASGDAGMPLSLSLTVISSWMATSPFVIKGFDGVVVLQDFEENVRRQLSGDDRPVSAVRYQKEEPFPRLFKALDRLDM